MTTSRRPDDDLDEELADYLGRSIERKISRGLSPAEAKRLARAELGSPAAIRDAVLDAQRAPWLAAIWQDVRHGARLMRRSQGLTALAVAVLSLGIGVNTALFSIVNALFLAPPQVRAPGELVYLYQLTPNDRTKAIMGQDADRLASLGQEIADFTTHNWASMNLTRDGATQPAAVELVDGRYFRLLGVRTAMGRPLGATEEDAASEPAVVISDGLWVRRFSGYPAILGQKIRLSGTLGVVVAAVVGVAEPGFRGVADPWSPTDVWITRAHAGAPFAGGYQIARLESGTSFERFQAFVESATETLKAAARQDPFIDGPIRLRRSADDIELMRFSVYRATEVRIPADPQAALITPGLLAGLTTVGGLVLLIAIANVAGLMLSQGVARAGEIAVRRALGASTARVTRQLLTETVLLAAAGGVIGLGVAATVLAVFRSTTPSTFALDVPLDWRVLVFAASACILTGVSVGLFRAQQAVRSSVLDALGIGPVGWSRSGSRIRHWIVIPQLALSVLLLVVASVHVRTLTRIELTELGYATSGGLVVQVRRLDSLTVMSALELQDAERRRAIEHQVSRARSFTEAVAARVRGASGVESVGLTSGLPFRGYQTWHQPVIARDHPAPASAAQTSVSHGYFEAMKIRLRAGRFFTREDASSARRVAVVSQSLARSLWPAGDAIGRALALDPGQYARTAPEWAEVIGVADDVHPVPGRGGDPRLMYSLINADQWISPFSVRSGTLVVRGHGAERPEALIGRVTRALLDADSFAEVSSVLTTEQMVGELLYPRRVAAGVLAAAGGVGLILAVVGLYGLVSYSVVRRQREIGIRATLGAGPNDLVGLVLRDGGRILAAGSLIGLVLAVLAVRFTAGLIPGLPVVDLQSFITVPLMLAAVILAACYLPARRAARVDPIEVLRST